MGWAIAPDVLHLSGLPVNASLTCTTGTVGQSREILYCLFSSILNQQPLSPKQQRGDLVSVSWSPQTPVALLRGVKCEAKGDPCSLMSLSYWSCGPPGPL